MEGIDAAMVAVVWMMSRVDKFTSQSIRWSVSIQIGAVDAEMALRSQVG